MQTHEEPEQSQNQNDWRRDPIWTLISTIIAATALIDFVLSLYPDMRLVITWCSICGVLASVVVLLWGHIVLLWAQGKERVKSLRPPLSQFDLLDSPTGVVLISISVGIACIIALSSLPDAGPFSLLSNNLLVSVLSALVSTCSLILAVTLFTRQARDIQQKEKEFEEYAKGLQEDAQHQATQARELQERSRELVECTRELIEKKRAKKD